MDLRISALLLLALTGLSAQPLGPLDSRGWINKGVQDFKAARFQDAVQSFQRAVDLDPSNSVARLYLASALMTQYVPGAESPENLEFARRAQDEFAKVLEVQPTNTTALSSLASLSFQQAQKKPEQEKLRRLDESASWYEKLMAADPQNKDAYYSLAVIDWEKWYAAWMRTRSDLGLRPEQPGPLPNPARQELKAQYSSIIEHGISNLEKALQIDPQYSDAMAYMNLLIRERADLADSPEQYRNEADLADQWVQKALDAKKAEVVTNAPAPPPPPSPTGGSGGGQRIRVGPGMQRENLIRSVDPVYPPLALQARIQGTVRFTAIIGRDGRIQNLQLVSGHPLLVQAAREAVSQWEYRPTLLNGEPVEVVTQIDVNFPLP